MAEADVSITPYTERRNINDEINTKKNIITAAAINTVTILPERLRRRFQTREAPIIANPGVRIEKTLCAANARV